MGFISFSPLCELAPSDYIMMKIKITIRQITADLRSINKKAIAIYENQL